MAKSKSRKERLQADRRRDKAEGIKEGSPEDLRRDKARDVQPKERGGRRG